MGANDSFAHLFRAARVCDCMQGIATITAAEEAHLTVLAEEYVEAARAANLWARGVGNAQIISAQHLGRCGQIEEEVRRMGVDVAQWRRSRGVDKTLRRDALVGARIGAIIFLTAVGVFLLGVLAFKLAYRAIQMP